MIKILLLIVILVSFTTAVAQSRDTTASQVEAGLAAQQVHYIFQNIDARVATDLLQAIPK